MLTGIDVLPASASFWGSPVTSIGGGLPAGYEPSGAVWHPRLNRLFVVGDGGQISMMNADGTDVSTWTVGGDLEGICIADPDSDFVYVGVEGEQRVKEFNLVSHAVTRTFGFGAMGTSQGSGLEALTFVSDPNHPEGGVFCAGLQADGKIYVFNVPLKSASDGLVATHLGTLTPVAGRTDISGLHFDPETRLLYAIFDSTNFCRIMRPDGTYVAESWLPGSAQEGITLSDEYMFIAQDSGAVLRYPLLFKPSLCEPPPGLVPILFVDASAADGLNDGTNWSDAFLSLNDALCAAAAAPGIVEEIWVAAGSYTPGGGGLERRRTFQLLHGVGLYGGFAGGETSRTERDPALNVTELTGEDPGLFVTRYMHHVVTAGTPINGIDETTTLDGFTITAGLADGPEPEFISHDRGAGLYNDGGSPIIANCVFRNNEAVPDPENAIARSLGGGMYDANGDATLINCMFNVNRADRGAGLYTIDSNLTLINCTFSGNDARRRGGGAYIVQSSPAITNCVLWNNQADGDTGVSAQIYGGTPNVSHSCIQDADPDDATVYPGVGNIDDDPQFADAGGGDLRPSGTSPCIDAGDNAALPADVTDLDGDGDTDEPVSLDLDGQPRFQGHPDAPDTGNPGAAGPPIVDMGAYEFPGSPTLVRIVGGDDALDDSASLVWPKAEEVGLAALAIAVDQQVSLVGASVTTTEGASTPAVSEFMHTGGTIHRVELTEPIPVGHWTIVTLTVAGATGAESVFELFAGHLPGDLNGDEQVNMNDVSSFGFLFSSDVDDPTRNRIDLNGDGRANLNDATLLGQLWHGTSGHDAWQGQSLPPKP